MGQGPVLGALLLLFGSLPNHPSTRVPVYNAEAGDRGLATCAEGHRARPWPRHETWECFLSHCLVCLLLSSHHCYHQHQADLSLRTYCVPGPTLRAHGTADESHPQTPPPSELPVWGGQQVVYPGLGKRGRGKALGINQRRLPGEGGSPFELGLKERETLTRPGRRTGILGKKKSGAVDRC